MSTPEESELSEREAWVLLVNATAMRGDCAAYHDAPAAMKQACKDRQRALKTLARFGIDASAFIDPHGMWRGADAWAKAK